MSAFMKAIVVVKRYSKWCRF